MKAGFTRGTGREREMTGSERTPFAARASMASTRDESEKVPG
jgi:hypothetical protein